MYSDAEAPIAPRKKPDPRFAHLAFPIDDAAKRDLGYHDARERKKPESADPAYLAGYEARLRMHPEDDPRKKTGWWDARFRRKRLGARAR